MLGRSDGRVGKFVEDWSRPGKPPPRAVPAAFIRECLLAGKPVLCEKPLVPGLAVARVLVALARERRVFLMEAVWTRFLRVYARVRDWLNSGAIGKVQAIRWSFCFRARLS